MSGGSGLLWKTGRVAGAALRFDLFASLAWVLLPLGLRLLWHTALVVCGSVPGPPGRYVGCRTVPAFLSLRLCRWFSSVRACCWFRLEVGSIGCLLRQRSLLPAGALLRVRLGMIVLSALRPVMSSVGLAGTM